MGVSGCMKIKESPADKMVKYINEKYDDTFEYVKPYGGYLGSKTKKIIVSSEKYPGYNVYVSYTKSDGQETFSDNYLCVKFYEQTYNYLKDTYQSAFGENIYLYYDFAVSARPKNSSDETTFEEFIAAPSSMVTYMVIIPYAFEESEKDEIAETIKETMSDLSAWARFYFVEPDMIISDNDEMNDCLRTKNFSAKLSVTKSNDTYSTFEWD